MRPFHVNYRTRDGHGRGNLVNVGFWLHGTPRLALLCRLTGHRPVVDGTAGYRDEPGARWVCCDRCGERPIPQGSLNPAEWNIGQPYTGPGSWDAVPVPDWELEFLGVSRAVWQTPGPWPTDPTGGLGGQLVLGGNPVGQGIEVKIGNSGSEQALAAHVSLGWPGALYLHTENHGTWLQRRLNPTGYDSRVVGVSIDSGRLRWRLWAKRDHHSSDTPRWQDGSIQLDPRDRLLGPARYSYTDTGDPVTAVLRMPHGDDHHVTLQLRRETFGRAKGRKRLGWTVDMHSPDGVPTKPGGRGRITGMAVKVSNTAVQADGWTQAGCAELARRLTADRVRYGWRPEETAEKTL